MLREGKKVKIWKGNWIFSMIEKDKKKRREKEGRINILYFPSCHSQLILRHHFDGRIKNGGNTRPHES
jgi:hypothetical protein